MDAEVEIPSFNAQLRALKKGQSLAKAVRFSRPDGLNEALSDMRRTVNASTSRARKDKPGSNFRVESGALLTSDNSAIIAVVTVTRL